MPGEPREVTANEVLSRLNDWRDTFRVEIAETRQDMSNDMAGLEKRVRDDLKDIRQAIRVLDYIPRGEFEAKHSAIDRRIATIEAAAKWLLGIVGGAVVLALLSLVITQGGAA